MHHHQPNIVRKIKVALLGVATAGVLFGSACSAVDLRQNFVAGTQAFIKGYTTDLWEAVLPSAEEIVSFGGVDE
jgi:hypothetical protein